MQLGCLHVQWRTAHRDDNTNSMASLQSLSKCKSALGWQCKAGRSGHCRICDDRRLTDTRSWQGMHRAHIVDEVSNEESGVVYSEVQVCEGLAPINGRNERRNDVSNLHAGTTLSSGASALY